MRKQNKNREAIQARRRKGSCSVFVLQTCQQQTTDGSYLGRPLFTIVGYAEEPLLRQSPAPQLPIIRFSKQSRTAPERSRRGRRRFGQADRYARSCIEVQDSGIGISEEDMTHVFERFFRADPARNAGTGGTGLGLAIAKWIVDRHGGHFELRSEPDAGTRITICLPKPSPTAA